MTEADRTDATVAVAAEIWFAFSAWLRIIEETEGGLWAGRTMHLADAEARERTVTAIEASPWPGDLTECLETFDRASGFVEDWTTAGEAPRGTSGAYLHVAVLDARKALEPLTAYLFRALGA